MLLQTPDRIIIIAYLALSLGVGLYFARRAGKSVEDFFLTGRRLSWWLAGTSIAAIAFTDYSFPVRILISTALCTTIWMTVTLLTAPVSDKKLMAFYRKVRPGGILWRRISSIAGEGERKNELARNLGAFGFGTAFTFLSIFGIGEMVFFSLWKGVLYLAGAAVSAYVVFVLVREAFRQMQEEGPEPDEAESAQVGPV